VLNLSHHNYRVKIRAQCDDLELQFTKYKYCTPTSETKRGLQKDRYIKQEHVSYRISDEVE